MIDISLLNITPHELLKISFTTKFALPQLSRIELLEKYWALTSREIRFVIYGKNNLISPKHLYSKYLAKNWNNSVKPGLGYSIHIVTVFATLTKKLHQYYIKPLQPGVAYLYPLKTSENLQVF